MKAKRTSKNAAPVFDRLFESLAEVRAAEREIAKISLDDYPIEYQTVATCPAGDGLILDLDHAFKAADGKLYHNTECAETAEMMAHEGCEDHPCADCTADAIDRAHDEYKERGAL